ncbi:glucosaminidase domain-containing protein [Pedobacter cryophilus]|uniref:Peptidoglycan hydrolase n=1 Tax=Pedobacter cryophilus TaxID=2571271 RepID=A0A4V5NY51_9SPHI|nr:glucosaminidase domain-containing protein [Pedobacter cryophilus]TKC00911.1 LysM peptidoglycan-binding domain-containing protein [Pedobacter cryophilus]
MNKLLITLSLIFLLSACSTKKKIYQKENKKIEKSADKKSDSNYPSYTTTSYISKFKNIAITEMNKYGIPASITLAQALLESGVGNSDLAKYANNHFGIKCTTDWKGKGYYKDDDQKDDCFRVYNNPEESFKDHSEFLKRKRYAALFELDKNDYEGWAKGLKAAGYATNPKYPDLLISIILRNNLQQYDRKEGEIEKIKREDRVLSDINNNIPKEKAKDKPTDATAIISGNKYVVQSGDTLYNISKRFGINIDELKALNNMTDNAIKIGQELTIKK